MSAIMKTLCFSFIILSSIATLFSVADARRFNVGGNGVWDIKPQENYNTWAGRNRFQVNDTLYFKYPKGLDLVQEVTKAEYDDCNVFGSIKKYKDGETVVTLDRSGPHYFISGIQDHCRMGQKMVVVVLGVRNHPKAPISPAQPPKAHSPDSPVAPAQAPKSHSPVSPVAPAKSPSMVQPPRSSVSPSQPPKSSSPVSHSPSNAPSHSPVTPSASPVSHSPANAPSHSRVTPSPSPVSQSPSNAPSHSPVTPSASPVSQSPSNAPATPSPSPVSTPSPDQSPASSPSDQSTPLSPSPSDSTTPSADTITAPAPSPKNNSASGVAVTSVMTTLLTAAFTFLMFA